MTTSNPVTAHAKHGYITDKDKYLNRLKRIEGQARGISKMVDEEQYCIDILTQISALTSALQAVAIGLLDDHLKHCVLDAARMDAAKLRAFFEQCLTTAKADDLMVRLTHTSASQGHLTRSPATGKVKDTIFQATSPVGGGAPEFQKFQQSSKNRLIRLYVP